MLRGPIVAGWHFQPTPPPSATTLLPDGAEPTETNRTPQSVSAGKYGFLS